MLHFSGSKYFCLIYSCSFVNELTGNLVGHLYYFLMFKYPIDLGGRSLISTPDILSVPPPVIKRFFFFFPFRCDSRDFSLFTPPGTSTFPTGGASVALEPLPRGDRWRPRSQREAAVAEDVTTGAKATAWGPTDGRRGKPLPLPPLTHTVGNAVKVLGVKAGFSLCAEGNGVSKAQLDIPLRS